MRESTLRLTDQEIEHFWYRVDVGGLDSCWEWSLARDKDGYGKWGIRRDGKAVSVRCNRIALQIKLGRPLPPEAKALHTCDNPPCCNPDHLYEGSQYDNEEDKVLRGRHANLIKAECAKGHPYEGMNIYARPARHGTMRDCQACRRTRAWIKNHPEWDFDVVADACYKHSMGAYKSLRAEGLIVRQTKG